MAAVRNKKSRNRKNPEKAAMGLLRKYKISEITLDDVTEMITDTGFDIVEYQPDEHIGSSAVLIDRLNLRKLLAARSMLSYQKDNMRLVFVDDTLGEEEKKNAIAHELGHIVCGHIREGDISEYTASEEREADVFAQCLLNSKAGAWIRRRVAACFAAALVLLGGLVAIPKMMDYLGIGHAKVYGDGQYYVVDDGERYHEKDCITIKGNETAHQMTAEEYETGRYSPCQVCLP